MQNLLLQITLVLIVSCNTSNKTDIPNDSGSSSMIIDTLQPKMIKTQVKDPYVSQHWNVHCSLQDRSGNLWFGTTGEGIYRFDGKTFTQFTEKDGLSHNTVWSMLEDKLGNIWIGTDDGLNRYDGTHLTKVPFAISRNGLVLPLPANTKHQVWSLMQDKSGIIWLGTNEDLYWYDGKSFTRFLDNEKMENNNGLQLKWVQSLLEDRNGIIWIGSGPIAMEGVIRYDGKSISNSRPNGDGWIRHIVEDKNGIIWFSGRSNGVFTYDGKNFTKFTEKEGIGSAILVDKSGNIWFDGGEKQSTIESYSGIWRYDGKSFKNFTTLDGLPVYSVWSMLEDTSGNIWIGTRNTSLYRFDGKSFVSFSEEEEYERNSQLLPGFK